MRRLCLVHTALAVLLLVTTIEAQSARRIPGYWVGVAGAAGAAGISCDGCVDSEAKFGPSAAVSIGRTLTSKLGLGLEVSGWWKEVDNAVDHHGYLMATGVFFPGRTGAFLTGGLGVSRFASEVGRGGDRTSALAGAWRVGVGYDLAVGREVSLAASVNYFRSLPAELKISGNPSATRLSQNLLQLGLGLHWNFSGAISFPAPTKEMIP